MDVCLPTVSRRYDLHNRSCPRHYGPADEGPKQDWDVDRDESDIHGGRQVGFILTLAGSVLKEGKTSAS